MTDFPTPNEIKKQLKPEWTTEESDQFFNSILKELGRKIQEELVTRKSLNYSPEAMRDDGRRLRWWESNFKQVIAFLEEKGWHVEGNILIDEPFVARVPIITIAFPEE